MDVYKLVGDIHQSRSIQLDQSKNEIQYPWFDGTPKGEWFEPQGLYIQDLRKPDTNFYYMASEIVFDEKALQLTGDLLEKAGEIFPIQVEGAGQLYILNRTLRIDALDKENYEPRGFAEGEPYGVSKYAFLPHKIGDINLFALSTLPPVHLFAVKGHQDENNEFIGRYLKHNLSGLELRKEWSGN